MDIDTVDRTEELLQQLGFARNEAKAYRALLACQPATAYEIAKQAAIPTSKIYETVNRLVARGVLQATDNAAEQGQQYVALPPADFIAQVRNTTTAQTTELLPMLEAVGDGATTDFIWPMTDQAQVRRRAIEMVQSARETILVSSWPEELAYLSEALEMAAARAVRIALVHFGEPRFQVGATYHHPVEKTLYEEKGGRGLTLVTDSEAVLIANYRVNGSVDGAWSKSQAFVTVAEDYVKHDVYITKVTRFLNHALVSRFGQDYERLRDVFNADA